MARLEFGGGAAEFFGKLATDGATLQLAPAEEFTVWDAEEGGTQVTDLTDLADLAIEPTLTTDELGTLPRFKGPDGVSNLWVDDGNGSPRRRIVTANAATGAPPASTVATGTVELSTLAEMTTGTDTTRVPPVDVVSSHVATTVDGGITDHKAEGDPHTQYHNDTRGDARYLLSTAKGAASGVAPLGADAIVPSSYLPTLVAGPHTHTLADEPEAQDAIVALQADMVTAEADIAELLADEAIIHDLSVASNFVVNNTTTPAIIPGLSFAVTAGDIWHVSAVLHFVATTAGDAKFNVDVPGGALTTILGEATGDILLTTDENNVRRRPLRWGFGDVNELSPAFGGRSNTINISNIVTAALNFRTEVGGTGTVNIKFAQNTAHASDAVVLAGSYLVAVKAATA